MLPYLGQDQISVEVAEHTTILTLTLTLILTLTLTLTLTPTLTLTLGVTLTLVLATPGNKITQNKLFKTNI